MTISKKQLERATEDAFFYAKIQKQIKELEKEAAPFKAALVEFAQKHNVTSKELGEVVIEKRVGEKVSFNKKSVTPDWLWRIQKEGHFHLVKVDLNNKAVAQALEDGCTELEEYLQEIKYETEKTETYAVKVR